MVKPANVMKVAISEITTGAKISVIPRIMQKEPRIASRPILFLAKSSVQRYPAPGRINISTWK